MPCLSASTIGFEDQAQHQSRKHFRGGVCGLGWADGQGWWGPFCRGWFAFLDEGFDDWGCAAFGWLVAWVGFADVAGELAEQDFELVAGSLATFAFVNVSLEASLFLDGKRTLSGVGDQPGCVFAIELVCFGGHCGERFSRQCRSCTRAR